MVFPINMFNLLLKYFSFKSSTFWKWIILIWKLLYCLIWKEGKIFYWKIYYYSKLLLTYFRDWYLTQRTLDFFKPSILLILHCFKAILWIWFDTDLKILFEKYSHKIGLAICYVLLDRSHLKILSHYWVNWVFFYNMRKVA